MQQLIDSGAYVDFTQGLDCRLLTPDNIAAINRVKLKQIHFAWDYTKESTAVLRGLNLYRELATRKPHGDWATVYMLTNYDTTMDENKLRAKTLIEMGFRPYVMVYDKPTAPREIRDFQRYINAMIYKVEPDFERYAPRA